MSVEADRLAGSTGMAQWRVLAVLLAVGVAGVIFLVYPLAFIGTDFDVYHGGAATLLDGMPLYDFQSSTHQLPFTYPPFAALAFIPLAPLPIAVAAACWALISVLTMEVVIWLLLGPLGVTDPVSRMRWTAIATVAMLPLAPVAFNLWVGQINLILLLLVIVDLVGRTGRYRGVAIGIAAGIKLTPLIFIPYLLLTRRWHAARTATLTFAATILVGFLLLPGDALRYWFGTFLDLNRIVPSSDVQILNSSIRGELERLSVAHAEATWLVLAGIVAVFGFAVSVMASRRGHDLASVLACGTTGLLISPISWIFHWVWCVPLLVIWAARAWRRNLPAEKVGVIITWLACAAAFSWIALLCVHRSIPESLALVFSRLFLVIGGATLVAIAVFLRREALRSVSS